MKDAARIREAKNKTTSNSAEIHSRRARVEMECQHCSPALLRLRFPNSFRPRWLLLFCSLLWRWHQLMALRNCSWWLIRVTKHCLETALSASIWFQSKNVGIFIWVSCDLQRPHKIAKGRAYRYCCTSSAAAEFVFTGDYSWFLAAAFPKRWKVLILSRMKRDVNEERNRRIFRSMHYKRTWWKCRISHRKDA